MKEGNSGDCLNLSGIQTKLGFLMEAINNWVCPWDILAVPHHLWAVFGGDELVQVGGWVWRFGPRLENENSAVKFEAKLHS